MVLNTVGGFWQEKNTVLFIDTVLYTGPGIKLINDFPSKLTAESESEASKGSEGSEREMIRDIYTTIATHNYLHHT